MIKGNLDVISKLTKVERPSERETERLERAILKERDTTERISKITKTMLSLSRNEDVVFLEEHSVKEGFDMAWALVESKMKEYNIKYVFDYDLLEKRAYFLPTHLGQVLINLFSNSIYAIQTSQNKKICIEGEVSEDKLFLYFRDSGKGIAKEVCERMF